MCYVIPLQLNDMLDKEGDLPMSHAQSLALMLQKILCRLILLASICKARAHVIAVDLAALESLKVD